MSDRELLELAAKAAGLYWRSGADFEVLRPDMVWEVWNPIDDDGDALRLAVKLGLLGAPNHVLDLIAANGEDDPYAATRLAIASAAAEIGRTMT